MFEYLMRFDARHVGSGVWGLWDAGVMSWRATNLSENEAKQQAADMNVTFNQYGRRNQDDRREVEPPQAVESASWSAAGELDCWVKERGEWWAWYEEPTAITSGSELRICVLPRKPVKPWLHWVSG